MNNLFVGCDTSVYESNETISRTFLKCGKWKAYINCKKLT